MHDILENRVLNGIPAIGVYSRNAGYIRVSFRDSGDNVVHTYITIDNWFGLPLA